MSQRTIQAFITHSVLPIRSEKRFQPEETLRGLKEKLHLVCGTPVDYMVIQVRDDEGSVLRILDGNETKLSELGVPDRVNLHIVDVDPSHTAAQFDDTSRVEKYVISEEDYAKRPDTFRKFKESALSKKPEERKREEEETARFEEAQRQAAQGIKVHDRCEIGSEGENPRRGEIMFVGEVHFKPGVWVGVKLDEPVGKNDGSVGGSRYFQCARNYGIFKHPTEVKVGNFPEIDPFAEDSDDQGRGEDVMAEL